MAKHVAPRWCSPAFGGRSLILHGVKDLRVESRPPPRPLGEHDVLIAPRSVGICGSDMHYYKDAVIGGRAIPFPGCHASCFGGLLGHEASGEVLEVGSQVAHLVKGDRVAIEPSQPCGRCKYCLGGRYNLCESMRFLGSFLSDTSGALCEQMVHDSRFCYKLPDNISYDEAALLEPMSVGLYAVRRGQVTIGSRVLVCGAGPVGLMAVICAKAAGASTVACTDISPERLQMAARFGADATYNVMSAEGRQEVPTDWTVALECSGVTSALDMALDCVEKGGRIVLVGMGKYDVEFRRVQLKELDVVGMFRYSNTYPAALSILSSGKVDIGTMVTHHFPLESASDAFKALCTDPTAVKIMIHPTPEPPPKPPTDREDARREALQDEAMKDAK